MALIECHIKSVTLGKETQINLIVPQKKVKQKYPVLYLLHGLSDDYTNWCRNTSIERYVSKYDLVVVMPDGGRSFYTDMVKGKAYWSYISEELPEILKAMFPISSQRADTFAAGLSMGGYGALKLGLRLPERYAAIGALSSVTDIRSRWNAPDTAGWRPEFANIFGSEAELEQGKNDLFALAKAAKNEKNLPKILSICGTEDFMYQDNLRFNELMRELQWPNFNACEYPGTHNWEFWDRYIQDILKFMLEDK